MNCKLYLLNTNEGPVLRVSESLFGYKTDLLLPNIGTLINDLEVKEISWDGLSLQSNPPQYRITLIFRDQKKAEITVSSAQFALLSTACQLKLIS